MSLFVDPHTGAIWPFVEGAMCPETDEWMGSTPWCDTYAPSRVLRVVYHKDGTATAEIETEDEILSVELYSTLQEYIDA